MSVVPSYNFFPMTKFNRYRHLWACFLALSTPTLVANQAEATGNNTGNTFETAKAIDLNQRYEGTLPVGQGRHCYRIDVPSGKKVAIQGSNNYGSVFVSAYTGHGETQILSSFQKTGQVETEETDGGVMVCVDSDMAQRQQEHRYSLQIAVAGTTVVAQASPPLKSPIKAPVKAIPTAPLAVAKIITPANTRPKNPLVVVARAPEIILYPQVKTRKSETRDSQVSPYVNSSMQLAANSRSFDRAKDGGLGGDTGNNFKTARAVTPEQMYGGYLNAKGKDDRDCYVYAGVPNGSKLKVNVANNDGILGISAYSDHGSILIGQTYIINQEGILQTEATNGDVMICMDTDGEKSDHQYTFNGRVEH
jgi:hypothetical protein